MKTSIPLLLAVSALCAAGNVYAEEGVLPSSRGVLPRSGTPEAAPPSAPTTPPEVTKPEPARKKTPRRPRRHRRGPKK